MKCPFCGKLIPEESWQEKVIRIGSFHESQQAKLGHAHTGRGKKKDGSTGWSLRDTAEHFGIRNRQNVLNFVTLYRAMKENGNLEKERTMELALRLLRK